jgi:hypothetical protein
MLGIFQVVEQQFASQEGLFAKEFVMYNLKYTVSVAAI